MDLEKGNGLDFNKKKKKCLIFCCVLTYFLKSIHSVIDKLLKILDLSWLRVVISYDIFNSLAELLN